MTELHCWQCGVEPDETVEVQTFSGATRTMATSWPDGDHQHSLTPPTPGELLAAGAHAYDRVIEEWTR